MDIAFYQRDSLLSRKFHGSSSGSCDAWDHGDPIWDHKKAMDVCGQVCPLLPALRTDRMYVRFVDAGVTKSKPTVSLLTSR